MAEAELDIDNDGSYSQFLPKLLGTISMEKLNVDVITHRYDEASFWNKIESYQIVKFEPAEMLTLVKDMIAGLLIGNKGDDVLYRLCLQVGSQLKDPNNTKNLLLLSTYPLIQEGNVVESIPTTVPGYWDEMAPHITREGASAISAEALFIAQQVNNMTAENALVFGPFLAFIIFRFGRRNYEACIKKLANLKEDFSKLYPGERFPALGFPSNPDSIKNLIVYLKPGQLYGLLRNTVFKAMIFRRHQCVISQSQALLLDFCLLQSLRFSGMPLLTLTFQVMNKYGINEEILSDYTLLGGTYRSWYAYSTMYEKYLLTDSASVDKYWYYAREFDLAVFRQMSFKSNFYLCGILAILLDEIYNPSNFPRKHNRAGPIYTNLFKPRPYIGTLDVDTFALFKFVAEKFREEYSENPYKKTLYDGAEELIKRNIMREQREKLTMRH